MRNGTKLQDCLDSDGKHSKAVPGLSYCHYHTNLKGGSDRGDPTSLGEHQKNVYFHLAASLGDVPSQSVIDPTYASQSIRSKRTPHLRKASHNSSSLNIQPSLAECFLAFEPNLLFRVERESMLLGQTQ